MPIRREGQFTVADRDKVSAWLGRESHMPKPAHVMTEDADMAKTLITYSQTQTAYQAALQAGAKIIQPTLMDFLTSP